MSRRRCDLQNRKFGRLTALSDVGNNARGQRLWLCACECGKETTVTATHLQGRRVKSCGCLKGELLERGPSRIVHGDTWQPIGDGKMHRTPEYSSWQSMKQRCLNPNVSNYDLYGARGITVCDRWRNDFEAFLTDMGRKPSPQHTLDRIDNDGDYEPDNCQWATPKEQANNRRVARPRMGV